MDRRTFLVTVAGGLIAVPLAAEAQQAGKVARVGVLMPIPQSSLLTQSLAAFRQGLRELGYVEGHTVLIEERWAGARSEALDELAAGLEQLKVDVIVVLGTQAALAVKKVTSVIPTVMFVGDPLESGLVSSLRRPGGNLTGFVVLNLETAGKRLELLKEAVPGLSRVAVLANPSNPAAVATVRIMQAPARALGIALQSVKVTSGQDFESAFATIRRSHADAVYVIEEPVNMNELGRIVEFTAKNRLPAMYGYREAADAGGLMSYATSWPNLFYRAASYVDKILKGANPGDLPIEQPTKFELVINLKTAKALGLTIPPSLLQRADQVIE
jgi:ABC-type uncharacterized transport system substrate-binding protein